MMNGITESYMHFGPYPNGQFFPVEKSACYGSIGENVKIAEFILYRNYNDQPQIWIIEAKSSSPRPRNQEDINQFIQDIRDKMVNTLSLYFACLLDRQPACKAELPDKLKSVKIADIHVRFVLVIHGHKLEWLSPLKDLITKAMLPTIQTWKFDVLSVVVLNDDMAREIKLIS